MRKFFFFLLAILLLPLCFSLTWTGIRLFLQFCAHDDHFTDLFILLGGILTWTVIQFWGHHHPTRVYVLAHELTHALCGLLFGAKIGKIKVSKKGGFVTLSKSNLLITLAPYFFPFYTMLVLLVYWIVSCFCTPVPFRAIWLFLIGFTWSFHICFTIESLMTEQPDFQDYGKFFSYIFIFLMNIFVLCVWSICTTDLTWKYFGETFFATTRETSLTLAGWASQGYHAVYALFQ